MLRLCNTTSCSSPASASGGCIFPFQTGSGHIQLHYRQRPRPCLPKLKHFRTIFPSVWCSRKSELYKRGSAVQGVIGMGIGLEGAESVLEAVAVLAVIVTVHECGHFLAAYLQRIHVSKFAIGFGPTLLKFDLKNVECSVRAIPLGGYVGFPDNDQDSGIPSDDKDLLKNRPILDRLLVTVAGVAANMIFAYSILFAQVFTVGMVEQEPFPGVLVPQVFSGSPAARDGMESGDVVLGVDGRLFGAREAAVFDLVDVIKKNPGKKMTFLVDRKGNLQLPVTPDVKSDGSGKIGVQLAPNSKIVRVKARDMGEGFVRAGEEFWRILGIVVEGLKQVFLNFSERASDVSGPVGIVAVGAEAARSSNLFQYAALVNLNLAVVNLLPLPALDGGYLALIALEAVRGGKKLPQHLEQAIMSSGITLVLFLGIFLIVRDTINLNLNLGFVR
ncbi:hypothetical protein KI387_019539 [Taxus chinensis]|uniref:PDZ domain-containing protein n=1 Tax=Taxus chinensis TaxID=29808 RepID=A0AA38GAA9_TAXCH|nr:hypothetical protein KI387_019539 [Taxus chinensis]